ncbi:MAG: NAD kinase [Bacteroidota bacterium]|jgi:NAD+ kinase
MLVYIYGIKFEPDYAPVIQTLLDRMVRRGMSLCIFSSFKRFLDGQLILPVHTTFEEDSNFDGAFALFSIGGDGTFLDAATLVGSKKVPILGINTGRLGFLSHVDIQEMDNALEQFVNSEYSIEKRSLIQIQAEGVDFDSFPYAVNEITVSNTARNEMVNLHASINDVFLSNYWADGLIVATPTGSTAYSLSCGGPIVTPNCQNFIVTPISAHNLTARPLIVGDTSSIKLKADTRNGSILISIDSKSYTLNAGCEIILSKAPFELHMILLEGQNFFRTIRKKMGWGIDIRKD